MRLTVAINVGCLRLGSYDNNRINIKIAAFFTFLQFIHRHVHTIDYVKL